MRPLAPLMQVLRSEGRQSVMINPTRERKKLAPDSHRHHHHYKIYQPTKFAMIYHIIVVYS
jgi:hypothetical protein